MPEDLVDASVSLDDGQWFSCLNGLWKGKKPPFKEVNVIRNTNFGERGNIDLSDVASINVESKQFESKKLHPGDIIIERSGGGPKQPVGRVVYFNIPDGNYSFSNFTSCIRVLVSDMWLSRFVFYYLLFFYESGKTESLQARTTGIRNLDFNRYKKEVQVPALPIREQKEVIRILDVLESAICNQDRIIKTTTELKKAMMQKLFTEGLKGLNPATWKTIKLDKVFKLTSGQTRPQDIRNEPAEPYVFPIYGGNGILGYSKEYFLEAPTIVLGRVGAYCGAVYISHNKCWISDNALYAKEFLVDVNLGYLSLALEFLDLNVLKNTGGQPLISQSIVYAQSILLPDETSQKEIANLSFLLDKRLRIAESRLKTLNELFQFMLQQLMTGQIRVGELKPQAEVVTA